MTNLTEKLKKGELPDNHHYYFKLPKSKEYEVGNTFCLETLRWCKDGDKIEVLSEVPSYEQWIMTKNLSERAHLEMYKARGEKVKLEAENAQLKKWCEEFNALEVAKENTKLKTENKWYSEQLNEAVKEIAKLKELLKECRSPINYALCLNLSEEEKKEFKNLLAKIKQVLADNKIQANTVACNKIQESE